MCIPKQGAETQGTWLPSVVLPFHVHVTQVKECSAWIPDREHFSANSHCSQGIAQLLPPLLLRHIFCFTQKLFGKDDRIFSRSRELFFHPLETKHRPFWNSALTLDESNSCNHKAELFFQLTWKTCTM